MCRFLIPVTGVMLTTLTLSASTAFAGAAEEVIAITKAQWAADMKKDVAAAMKNVADDYTEFNPDYPTRLDGKAMSVALAEAFTSGSGNLVAAAPVVLHVL